MEKPRCSETGADPLEAVSVETIHAVAILPRKFAHDPATPMTVPESTVTGYHQHDAAPSRVGRAGPAGPEARQVVSRLSFSQLTLPGLVLCAITGRKSEARPAHGTGNGVR